MVLHQLVGVREGLEDPPKLASLDRVYLGAHAATVGANGDREAEVDASVENEGAGRLHGEGPDDGAGLPSRDGHPGAPDAVAFDLETHKGRSIAQLWPRDRVDDLSIEGQSLEEFSPPNRCGLDHAGLRYRLTQRFPNRSILNAPGCDSAIGTPRAYYTQSVWSLAALDALKDRALAACEVGADSPSYHRAHGRVGIREQENRHPLFVTPVEATVVTVLIDGPIGVERKGRAQQLEPMRRRWCPLGRTGSEPAGSKERRDEGTENGCSSVSSQQFFAASIPTARPGSALIARRTVPLFLRPVGRSRSLGGRACPIPPLSSRDDVDARLPA